MLNRMFEDMQKYLSAKFKDSEPIQVNEAAEVIACRAWRLACEMHENYMKELRVLENKNRRELLNKLIEKNKERAVKLSDGYRAPVVLFDESEAYKE